MDLLNRLVGKTVSTPAGLVAERLNLLEASVERVVTNYHREVMAGEQDAVVLLVDARVRVDWIGLGLAKTAFLAASEEARESIAQGDTPLIISAVRRQVLADFLHPKVAATALLCEPAPPNWFWVVVLTETGLSVAAVGVGDLTTTLHPELEIKTERIGVRWGVLHDSAGKLVAGGRHG